jgi:hypothetical protein
MKGRIIAGAALALLLVQPANANWQHGAAHGATVWHGGGGWHGQAHGSWGWHGGHWSCCWAGNVFLGLGAAALLTAPLWYPPPVYYAPPPQYYGPPQQPAYGGW